MTTVATLFSVQSPTIAISGSSTATAAVALPGLGGTIRFVNEGPNNAYVAVGIVGALATLPGATPSVTSVAIPAGEDIAFGIPNDARLGISVICRATATCVLLVSVGEGA